MECLTNALKQVSWELFQVVDIKQIVRDHHGGGYVFNWVGGDSNKVAHVLSSWWFFITLVREE